MSPRTVSVPDVRRAILSAARSVVAVLVLAIAMPTALAASYADLDGFLDGLETQIGAFGLCLVHDGEIVCRCERGGFEADRPLPIYSASKWLAAATISALIDDGLLTLEDRAADWFPGLAAGDAGITVRHLFSHTSGLPADVPGGICTDAMTLADCAERLAALPILTQPGKVFTYGEVSMQIGGAIAELASELSWHELFATRVADPLGMERTDFRAFGASLNPVLGGGARSTLDDYTRFVTMLLAGGTLDGVRVLSPGAVDAILAEQTTEMVHGPENGYGLGCWRDRVDPISGDTLLASSPGARGFTPWVDLGHGIAGVLAADGDGPRIHAVFLELLDRIDAIHAVDDPAAGSPTVVDDDGS
jgi:CubicO group peptidase (beta-lactamase class C family)